MVCQGVCLIGILIRFLGWCSWWWWWWKRVMFGVWRSIYSKFELCICTVCSEEISPVFLSYISQISSNIFHVWKLVDKPLLLSILILLRSLLLLLSFLSTSPRILQLSYSSSNPNSFLPYLYTQIPASTNSWHREWVSHDTKARSILFLTCYSISRTFVIPSAAPPKPKIF